MRFYLGATATLPLFPPRSQAARGGMCVCVRGQRGVRACKTCQGCVKCVLVGASVCWAGSVCVSVGIPASVRCADVISYHTDVADLQSNIPAPPSMAVFPNYCTYMFLSLLSFYLHDHFFPYKTAPFFFKGEQFHSRVFSSGNAFKAGSVSCFINSHFY